MNQEAHQIVEELKAADRAYYSGLQYTMSDSDYDSLKDLLKSMDPSNEYLNSVGYILPTDSDGYVVHRNRLLSMNKMKSEKDIQVWYKGFNIPYDTILIGEPKIDGISINLTYENGDLIGGTTRGDSFKGKLIHFIDKNLQNPTIPIHIPHKVGIVEVRGEMYIRKELGNTVFKDIPLRNMVAGIVNSKDNIDNVQYVSFIAYQIVMDKEPFKTESEMVETLRKWKFDAVSYIMLKDSKAIRPFYEEYVSSNRELYPFETDGVVIIINDRELQEKVNGQRVVRNYSHHRWALKPPCREVFSKLRDIEFNVSKSGNIIPIAVYEPVYIENVRLERATLDNYENVVSFGEMFVGNTVQIIRGNDVIPKILKIFQDGDRSKKIKIPTSKCPSCGEQVTINGKHLMCLNRECPGKVISEIYHWIEKRDMKGIGWKILEKCYSEGVIRSVLDLYDPLLSVKLGLVFPKDGLLIPKIMQAIEKSKQHVTDLDILASIGIPHIGRLALENVNVTDIATLKERIAEKRGLGIAVFEYLNDWVEAGNNYKMLLKLKKLLKSDSKAPVEYVGSVCITGRFDKTRKEIEEAFLSMGYRIDPSVTKSTTYLLVGDDPSPSKIERAKEVGTHIWNDLILRFQGFELKRSA